MAESKVRARFSRWLSGRRGERILRDLYATHHSRLPDRFVSEGERKARQYDRDTVRIATATMNDDSAFVDAGAHAGTILKHLVKIAPNGRGYAFEPIPSLCRELRSRYPSVTVEGIALSDYDGTADFHYLTSNPALSSLIYHPAWEQGGTVKRIPVPVRRLDDCVPPDVHIAFLKVDVEGVELALLRGSRRILADNRPVVVFECSHHNLPDVAAFLKTFEMEVCFLSRFPDGSTEETLALNPGSGEYCFAAAPNSTP